MPGSVELDLARRYGGKVRSGTATTCRFLLEAPPLGYVVQRGAGHGITRVSDCVEKPGKGFYGLPLKGIRSLAQWRGGPSGLHWPWTGQAHMAWATTPSVIRPADPARTTCEHNAVPLPCPHFKECERRQDGATVHRCGRQSQWWRHRGERLAVYRYRWIGHGPRERPGHLQGPRPRHDRLRRYHADHRRQPSRAARRQSELRVPVDRWTAVVGVCRRRAIFGRASAAQHTDDTRDERSASTHASRCISEFGSPRERRNMLAEGSCGRSVYKCAWALLSSLRC